VVTLGPVLTLMRTLLVRLSLSRTLLWTLLLERYCVVRLSLSRTRRRGTLRGRVRVGYRRLRSLELLRGRLRSLELQRSLRGRLRSMALLWMPRERLWGLALGILQFLSSGVPVIWCNGCKGWQITRGCSIRFTQRFTTRATE